MRLLVPTNRESRDKVMRSMSNTGFLSVWEGAVRSGKTVFALAAFAQYVVTSPERCFMLSGRTIKTAEKNCILEEYGLLNMIPGAVYFKGDSTIRFTATVDGCKMDKVISVFGASDIRAYMSIRGMSFAGWFADEINMHDKEFVIEALKRTVVSTDRKNFWTLNPDHPRHWVYTDYLDRYDAMTKAERKKLGGYHWWHFTPKDNPAMTSQMMASLELQFPQGTYLYDRYILGKRCIAEGLIYPKVTSSYFRDFDRKKVNLKWCAIDFGADHPTVMVFGGYFEGNRKDWRIVKEYYDKGSDKTTYDHYCSFLEICKELDVAPNHIVVAIDPSALSLRKEFQKHGLGVVKAKNDVLPGINYTRRVIYDGILSFHSSMKHTLEEFGTYSWESNNQNTGAEKPVKINDDCMDAVRYFSYTFIQPIVQ